MNIAIRACILFILGQNWASAQTNKTSHVLESREKPAIQAVLDYQVKCPNVTATEWIVVVPVAPELPAQKKVKTTFNLPHKRLKEQSDEAREVLVAQVPVKTALEKTTIDIEVIYDVTLFSRTLRPLKPGETAPKVEALPTADRQLYLAQTPDLNFADPKFQKWMAAGKLKRGDKESDVEFARRVFAYIRVLGQYEYLSKMDRRVSVVCETNKTDCGGFSQLFAAALRANGIPARCLYGRWAESAKPTAKLGKIDYFQWHVIAEFYADRIGWVPADVSSSIVHEKSGAATKHFGQQPGTFLTQHIDGNLKVDSIHFGVHDLQNIQQPSWWVRGTGKVDGAVQTEGWKVTIKK